jgi:hypothetical protein
LCLAFTALIVGCSESKPDPRKEPAQTGADGGTYVVNLEISNGQSTGSVLVAAAEEKPGAFTVANLNDTDGDGVPDNTDKKVVPASADKGRNEVDLMRLLIHKPEPDKGETVTLKVVSGNVALWKKSTKEDPIPLTNKEVKFKTSDLNTGEAQYMSIWVELPGRSKSLRDVVLTLEYKGVKDTVKATGIWMDCNLVRSTSHVAAGKKDKPSANATDDYYLILWQQHVSRLGATQLQPRPGNPIEFEFKVFPVKLGDAGVYFDISRQKDRAIYVRRPGSSDYLLCGAASFPNKAEAANDEAPAELSPAFWKSIGLEQPADDEDDDETPAQGFIYSFDAPGLRSYEVADVLKEFDLYVYQGNFKEFVRVKFDNDKFLNTTNGVEGSRCSNYVNWHARSRFSPAMVNGKKVWAREAVGNSVGKNHVAIDPKKP